MRRVAVISLVFVLSFVLNSFADSKSTVPDLSGSNWKFLGENNVNISSKTNDGQTVGLETTAKYYENDADKLHASVLMWNNNEVAMLYGDNDVHLAIKTDGKWYEAKKNKTLESVVVYGKDGKPTGVKLSLDTTEGYKEVVLAF